MIKYLHTGNDTLLCGITIILFMITFAENRFPDIKHSHDIWHAAKNLGKKIVAAGQNKECRGLLEWSRDVINHFWYSCSCATDVDSFMVSYKHFFSFLSKGKPWQHTCTFFNST